VYVNRLIEFAEGHPELFPPIGFQKKKIDWIVDVDNGSLTFNAVERLEMTVPSISRSGSGESPILLVDKPDYVFGWSPSDNEQERSVRRHSSYMQLLDDYTAETEDPDITALIIALQNDIDFPAKMKPGDFVVFRTEDERYLHEASDVQRFWSERMQPPSTDGSFVINCQFCGEPSPAMERHSINFIVNGERTKMISANKNAYESHGLKNSMIAPTCSRCEQKYGQALEHMLSREPKTNYGRHMFSIGDLTYVYWLRGQSAGANLPTAMRLLHEANPEAMRDLIHQLYSGQQVSSTFHDFCLLMLSANKGRLVVRGYVEESIGSIEERIARFFKAQDIGRDRSYNVYTLAGTIYQKPNTQMKRTDVQDWINWALRGTPLPGRILIALLKRIQAEGVMYPTHAAVLKSWLTSQDKRREWTVTTDETNKAPAYILGRVFAVLEKIQGEATGSSDTLSSRYIGSASTAPRSVMSMLIRNAKYHLAKIGSRNKGRAVNLDKRLSGLLTHIDTLPAVLKLSDQGEFTLGYYHEKESLWKKKEETTCTSN